MEHHCGIFSAVDDQIQDKLVIGLQKIQHRWDMKVLVSAFIMTIKSVTKKLKEIGVNLIHIRVASPIITDPCFFGIDMLTKEELFSFDKSLDEIKKNLGVDSLRYLEIDKMKNVFNMNVCTSGFTSNYNR